MADLTLFDGRVGDVIRTLRVHVPGGQGQQRPSSSTDMTRRSTAARCDGAPCAGSVGESHRLPMPSDAKLDRDVGGGAMPLRRWALINCALGAICLAACTADPAPKPDAESSNGVSTTPSTSPSSSSGESVPQAPQDDPLASTAAPGLRGFLDSNGLVRAGDGSTLLVFAPEYADRAQYRVYDRNWRPRTPLLEVPVRLLMERGLAHGFVGHAERTRRDGTFSYAEWVTIDADGALRAVPHQPARKAPPVRIGPGDVRFQNQHTRSRAYRPSTRTVIVIRAPAWNTRRHSWYTTATGTICAHVDTARLGDVVHTSVDEGRTWLDLDTDLLPVGSGPRVQSCEAHGSRVIVMTGGESPRWLHTLDRVTGRLLSSHPLGGTLDGYGWQALPDGTLVVGTNRRGLMVATDATNRVFEFRPGPVRAYLADFDLLGHDIVVATGRRALQISTDEGQTWHTIDLRLPRE
jgi:hypothetical protein